MALARPQPFSPAASALLAMLVVLLCASGSLAARQLLQAQSTVTAVRGDATNITAVDAAPVAAAAAAAAAAAPPASAAGAAAPAAAAAVPAAAAALVRHNATVTEPLQVRANVTETEQAVTSLDNNLASDGDCGCDHFHGFVGGCVITKVSQALK